MTLALFDFAPTFDAAVRGACRDLWVKMDPDTDTAIRRFWMRYKRRIVALGLHTLPTLTGEARA